MKLLLDYNPLSRETVWFSADSATNQVTITHEQDVEPHLRLAHANAVDDDLTKAGIGNDMWKYAHIPNTIIIEMKQKHGVDIFDRNDQQKVFDLLNGEYSRFKTTTKHHRPRKR